MNYEVILDRKGRIERLYLSKTNKDAQAYMRNNYEIIENWFENFEFDNTEYYDKKLKSYIYEHWGDNGLDTIMYARKLTK